MFKITQKTSPDKCAANRCKATPAPNSQDGGDPHPSADVRLCMAHLGEWHTAGRPALETSGSGRPKGSGKGGGALAVSEALKAEMAAEEATAKTWLANIDDNYTIASFATPQLFVDKGREMLQWLAEQRALVEARREQVSKPLYAAWKAHNAQFTPKRDYIDAGIKLIKDRIAESELAQRAAQQQALGAVADGARDETTLVVAHGVQNVDTGAKRIVIKAKITDADSVIRQLCSPDMDKIQAVIDQYGRECLRNTLPGIEFYEDVQIINRREG